jgi:plasmid stabilization system protein ParE
MRIVSRIGESTKLTREAENAGASAQQSIDRLTSQLAQGNLNPGIGTRQLFNGIREARARDGARVYFRQVGDTIEILAKSTKANQKAVISALQQIYGR